MSQPPSDVPPLILPPPLPAAKEDDYADSGIRAIDLSERPVAESLREIMASSPRVPREVPPPLPPVTSVHHNRHWTLALLGLVYLFSAFLIAGEGVWCLVSHDSDAAPMDWAESVRLWLENPVWVAWGLTLGLGLILARRWARRLVMAEAISFLVSSLVVALALAADAWPNVTTHVAADDDTAVWYYLVALGGVAVLAGLLFAILRPASVRWTCEQAQPAADWTDRCAPSELWMVVVLLNVAVSWAGLASGHDVPCWGVWQSAGSVWIWLAASLAAFTAAILTARRRRSGVILAMLLITLHGSSVVWTAFGQPAETLTALWGGWDFQRRGGVVFVGASWLVFMVFALAAGRAQRRRRAISSPVHQGLS
jgi:hypothetical protein